MTQPDQNPIEKLFVSKLQEITRRYCELVDRSKTLSDIVVASEYLSKKTELLTDRFTNKLQKLKDL